MSESSGFWTTGGATGDQVAGYTQAHWSTAAEIMSSCTWYEGVSPSYLSRLLATAVAANTVRISAGGALVDGKWYQSTANVDVNIPSAVGGGNTRIDRIVARASWAGFTVRITRIAGTDDPAPVAPAITQTSGTTYDIPICQVLVDTAGSCTVTDERTFASNFSRRLGGSATEWAATGTTSYRIGIMQACVGSSEWTGVAATSGSLVITLPITYSDPPLVIGSIETDNAKQIVGGFEATGADEITFNWFAADGATTATSVKCHWYVAGVE